MKRVFTSILLAALPVVGLAIPAQAGHGGNVHCGDTISGTVALTGNVVDATDGLPCTGDGVVMASNATLDLKGFKILGQTIAANADEAGILFDGVTGATVTDSTVANGVITNSITGFDAGIALINGSDGNTIEKVNVVGNVGLDGDYGEGIHVRDSLDNTIKNSNVAANGPYGAITLLDDSDGNTIENNAVAGNIATHQDIAIRLEVSLLATAQCPDDNVVTGNTIVGNALDGISILNGANCDSEDNELSFNTISGHARDGIRLNARQFGTTASTVKGALRTLVHDNTVTGNGGSGIKLTAFVEDSDIEDNVAVGNNPIIVPPDVVNPLAPPHGDLHDGNKNCTANVTGGVANTWSSNTHVTEYAASGSATGLLPTDFVCIA